MERRDWNELPVHCLVEVLSRVGIESIVETAPLVCKSWYEATLYPQCWQRIVLTKSPYLQASKRSISTLDLGKHSRFNRDLHRYHSDDEDDTLETFLRFAVGRGQGLVTEIVFPFWSHLKEGQIAWIAQRCPSLKVLVLPSHLSYVINFEISDSICKWKDLERLQVGSLIGLKKTIANISKHCQNFNHLSVYVARLDGDIATAIATQLPNIKTLDLRFSSIEREDLVVLLKGCLKLELLDVSGCKGVANDEEILKLASHIRIFIHEGSSYL